ncbi:MAG: HD domain-containing protein [Desulfobacterales bacterium]|nr:HD domain-containing protein [Desulfobacterales bacterium]
MLKAGGKGKTGFENEASETGSVDGERFKRQIDFILEADKLKNVARRTTLLDVSRQENSAEHSWHIALLVLILSEYAKDDELDLLQVIKLLLIHDLVEIDAGDTYCYDEGGGQDQYKRETKAADRIFNILPADQAASLRALWDEYEAKDTPESKFANALDRVQPFLHNYFTRGHTWQKHGIQKKQVIARMQPVNEGSQLLWEYVSFLIDDAVEKGYLAK